jgi:type I restriction enzyme S subunit
MLRVASLARLRGGVGEEDAGGKKPLDPARFYLNSFGRMFSRPEHVVDLRKAILDLAVQGGLGAMSLHDPPAHSSPAKGGDSAEARTSRGPGSTGHVPSGWARVALRDVLTTLRTGPFGSSLHQSDYREGGTPVVNPTSLVVGRIVPLSKMAVDAKTLDRLASFRLREGDIVLGRRGEMGRCAVVTAREAGWLCGTGSLVLRFSASRVFPRYMALLIGPRRCARPWAGAQSVRRCRI